MNVSRTCYIAWLLVLLLGHSSDERNYTPAKTHKEAHGTIGTEQAAETVQLAALRDIYLTAESMPKGDLLEGITVTSGDRSRQFDWATVTNPIYSPRLYAVDLNADANDEIIVILTIGTGTGVLEEDIHVLDAMLNEILVEDPVAWIEQQTTNKIISSDNQISVQLDVQGTRVENVYNRSDAGSWNEALGFGSIVKYDVKGQQITARVSAQASPTVFVGDLEVTYTSSGFVLRCGLIQFADFDEERNG
ncbi:hypothetical protein [Paenibacillus oceani]|uniref:Uncharacterized protein n=1 Tax=Paenibacillus oceani TaxID=2772510 RepID=A0A927GZU1_9BACL|nr:hypothetical protein [Paenibacillus oceani]MBD2862442.1 hypothetical protein [Paenibacillus oceani]